MKRCTSFAALGVAALALTGALAGGPVESGPKAGDTIPGSFHPLNITGPNAGEKSCLV